MVLKASLVAGLIGVRALTILLRSSDKLFGWGVLFFGFLMFSIFAWSNCFDVEFSNPKSRISVLGWVAIAVVFFLAPLVLGWGDFWLKKQKANLTVSVLFEIGTWITWILIAIGLSTYISRIP